MTINKKLDGEKMLVEVEGRLDTTTAPSLDAELNQSSDLAAVKELVFDFEKLEYVSSAGLRVLLGTQKTMNTHGKMVIKNVNDAIMEVFEITGFSDILTIER